MQATSFKEVIYLVLHMEEGIPVSREPPFFAWPGAEDWGFRVSAIGDRVRSTCAKYKGWGPSDPADRSPTAGPAISEGKLLRGLLVNYYLAPGLRFAVNHSLFKWKKVSDSRLPRDYDKLTSTPVCSSKNLTHPTRQGPIWTAASRTTLAGSYGVEI